jgi:hypothetical protein
MEILFNEALEGLRNISGNSIRIENIAGLGLGERFKHLKELNLDLETEAVTSLAQEQEILFLQEKWHLQLKWAPRLCVSLMI